MDLVDNFGVPVAPREKLVVYVSSGGTCRCAMANVLTREYLKRGVPASSVRSMSLALHTASGQRMSAHAAEVLRDELHVEAASHQTIEATTDYLHAATLLLAMDEKLLDQLLARLPAGKRRLAHLFAEFYGGEGSVDDPYGRGLAAYRSCYRKIQPIIEVGVTRLAGL